MKLSPSVQSFIAHWGSMGTKWGVNRTVAMIHALLYLSPRPVPADEIAEALGVARSNVSTSLRELQSWRLVQVVPVLGDRRDHFTTMADVWELFQVVVDERKRREIDPTVAILEQTITDLDQEDGGETYAREQLESMLDFIRTSQGWYEEVVRLPTASLKRLASMGTRIRKLLLRGGD